MFNFVFPTEPRCTRKKTRPSQDKFRENRATAENFLSQLGCGKDVMTLCLFRAVLHDAMGVWRAKVSGDHGFDLGDDLPQLWGLRFADFCFYFCKVGCRGGTFS